MTARRTSVGPLAAVLFGLLVLATVACGGPARSDSARSSGDAVAPELLAGYVEAVWDGFDEERAFALVAELDRWFRVRGNEGYQRALDAVANRLREAGFDEPELRRLELGPVRPTWAARSARLELLGDDDEVRAILHAFEDEAGRDRATLLIGSDALPAAAVFEVVEASALRSPAEARGRVVLARGDPWELGRTWIVGAGAAGLLTRHLEPYHERLGDNTVAQFGYLPPHGPDPAFGFSISSRSEALLRGALAEQAVVRVRVSVAVEVGESAASALELTLPGARPELGPVVLVAHVDEPGANDNGSGVAALAELAAALRSGMEAGRLPRPVRPLIFLWGQEIEVSREWLGSAGTEPFAGLVLDMVGQDPAVVGAPFLIERLPDPAAVWLRPPDTHTEWGGSVVSPEALWGHFLNDYALAAVALVAEREGGWAARSNPFEGGSDHESFLSRRIPAILAWHFTDAAYHTTHDRLDRVSAREMRRVSAALGAVAVGLARGRTGDVAEVLAVVEQAAERRSREMVRGALAMYAVCASPGVEHRIAVAWAVWYDQALASVASAATEPLPHELRLRIDAARQRWHHASGRLASDILARAPAARAHCAAKSPTP